MGEETEKPNKIGVVATVSKRPRHRKKLLYQALKKQMEFYFSDVNISKDRFMNDLLQKSPCVDLWVFLNFNKIKSMTTKVKDIANALESSDILKVTEDGKQVYRITAPQKKENSDECTIYVEQMPFDADHSWLTDIFQVYGPIDYVSIPKFKQSRKNKGFAFIEFKDPESAKNALAAFSEIGGCLSNQMDPGNLCSIRTFEENECEIVDNKSTATTSGMKEVETSSTSHNNLDGENVDHNGHLNDISDKQTKEKSNRRKRMRLSESGNADDDNHGETTGGDENSAGVRIEPVKIDDASRNISDKEIKDEINHRKRKCSSEPDDGCGKKKLKCPENESSVEEGAEHLKRKRKLSESNKLDISHNDGSEVVELKGELSQVHDKLPRDFEDNDTDNANESGVCESDSKECSGLNDEEYDENIDDGMEDDNDDRKKKNRRKRKKHRRSKAADNSFGLQILPKKEWKSLRNRYLNEQRRKMKELKQYIRNKRYNDDKSSMEPNHNFNGNISKRNASKCDQKIEKSNLANDSSSGAGIKVQISERLTLTPGLIVKVTLQEPVLSKASIKNELKIFPEIKYIDVREGLNIVFLRFSSGEAAEQFVKSGHWADSTIIKDDEEKAYWDKIAHEREEKLTKGRSVKRGRDKILKKAEDMHVKHIWFDK